MQTDTQLGIVLRPKSFTDIIGHEDIVTALQAKFDKGEVPRAIMFVGPAGTGKTTLAHIIARAAQGFDFPTDADPELVEINAASLRGIDATRELVDGTGTYPMVGKVRVILLDEAHMLTREAQNLLLKPFEASHSANLWIICTTETAKILPALVSRCVRFDLKRFSKKEIHDLLVRAAEHLGHEDFADFETEAIREHLDQPRSLLSAFENYHNGMSPRDAVNSQTSAYSSNHFEIAKVVVYGSWDKPSKVWGQDAKSAKELLLELEETFKKNKNDKATDTVLEEGEEEPTIGRDEAVGRPETSRILRSIVGALLKNMVIKGNLKAAEALYILAHGVSPNPFDAAIEYPATIGALYRINLKMRG